MLVYLISFLILNVHCYNFFPSMVLHSKVLPWLAESFVPILSVERSRVPILEFEQCVICVSFRGFPCLSAGAQKLLCCPYGLNDLPIGALILMAASGSSLLILLQISSISLSFARIAPKYTTWLVWKLYVFSFWILNEGRFSFSLCHDFSVLFYILSQIPSPSSFTSVSSALSFDRLKIFISSSQAII